MKSPPPKSPFLFLLSTLRVGGSERKTVLIANELWSKGYPVHVAYLNEPDTLVSLLDPDIPLACLNRKGKFSPGAMFRLRRYIRSNSIGAIFCINLYPMLYALPLAALWRDASLKCSVFINTTDFPGAKGERQMMIYAPMLRRVDKLIFGCRQQEDMWTKKYKIDRSKSLYIYNGVDTRKFSVKSNSLQGSATRQALGLPEDGLVIGTVGQLRPEKHHRDLLSACAGLIDAGYGIFAILVGEGGERERLEAFALECGIQDKVFFLGELADVRPALAVMDIFVLTSTSVETFSNAALEAMAMSRPAVLSNIGGSPEMIEEGVNGFIYPCGDVNGLESALISLIDDPQARQTMGDAARRIVEEKFTFTRMVRDYEQMLLSGVDERSMPR